MNDILGIFRVIREEWLSFWIFVSINLFFGGMAIWLPPALATQHETVAAVDMLLDALEVGNGYFFALALLAAASSYMVREYRENTETQFKSLKMYATSASFLLMVFMAMLLAVMTYKGFAIPAPTKNHHWGPIGTQVVLIIFALLMAAYLFCLERLDQHPDFGQALKDQTTKKLKAGMDGVSKTGIKT